MNIIINLLKKMESTDNSNNIISNSNVNNINEISEQNEFEKMTEYYKKINEYKNNNYINFLFKGAFCDCYLNGEWVECFIEEKHQNGIIVINMNQYYTFNNNEKYQIGYSDRVAYFRKHTRPSSNNIIPLREKKNLLANRISSLINQEKKNIFKDDNINNEEKVFRDFYFLHSTLYKSIDYSICRSKDKSSGVEEGFRIIVIVLEYLSEFYNYIKNNFEEFINYRNNIVDSELADMVLFNKKYAIFSFWDDANLLMNKIFLNNINYLDWFVESEKVLQKIIPSSQNMKKITSNEKLLCPLYESQIASFKNQNYNYTLRSGHKLIISKKICIEEGYKNSKILDLSGYNVHSYILCYFIDYFYALGGYNALLSLCQEYYNIKISINIFDNILYAYRITDNFKGIFESERNGINKVLFKFLDTMNSETLKTFSRKEIINFLKKGSNLYPNIKEQNSYFFEELYLRFILKNLVLANKLNKILEGIDDINNIIYSIDYYQLFNESNYKKNNDDSNENKKIDELINSPKFDHRDKSIREMSYYNFCLNCKNNGIIEKLFKADENNMIHEEIIIRFAPTLFVMYKNNFGYRELETNIKAVKDLKRLIFDKILNKIKELQFENINALKQVLEIMNKFCEILTDDDKYYIFLEIKNIFYNSIFNQNNTFELFFVFIKKFSSIAVKKTNIYKISNEEDIKKENNKDYIKNISNKEKKENNIDESTEEIQNINNFSFDEQKYYGLELIYNYLSAEYYEQLKMDDKKKKNFLNLSIDSVIEVISSIKNPKFIINIILRKIYNSIDSKKDVLEHLLLLQKLLIQSKPLNFSVEFASCLSEFLKKFELIVTLINEINSFLNNLENNKIIDINSENEINTNISNIQNDNKNENQELNENIKIRIKTIFNVIMKYNKTTFNYNSIKEFFMKMIKFNEFTKNTLYHYLNQFINKFSKDILMYLFTSILSDKNIFNIDNLVTYQICKNIIIQINKKENHLYLMNNQDILYILNNNDIEGFVGINLLWGLLLDEEKNLDNNIIDDLIDFLCNLFFGVRIKTSTNIFKAYEEYWTNLINKISEKLQKLTEEKQRNLKGIKNIILLIKKIISKINNNNGEVIKDLKEINQESKNFSNINKDPPKEYTFIGNKIGYDNYYMLDIKVNNGDLFYILRYELSNFYNMPVNQIGFSAHVNNLGKNKKLNQKDMDKLYKNKSYRDYNFLNDFDNIYESLNGLYEFHNKGKKKFPLIIEVKLIKNIWKDIVRVNPLDIFYTKTKLPITLMNLLKGEEAPYTFDVLCLVKGNNNDSNSSVICKEIENIITSNNLKNDLFNFENSSIYYISYIISNLNDVIKKNQSETFFEKFLKGDIWNKKIKNLNVINDDYNYNLDKNQKMPLLGELYEKYNLTNNLVNIYITIAENLGRNDTNLIWFIICKVIKIYKYIINESMNINLYKCGKSEGISIDKVKNLYFESLSNINNLIINNEKILDYIIKSLVSNEQNDDMKEIKNIFEYIIFESILKNKYKKINKIIKTLIFDFLNKLKDKKESKLSYNYLFELYLNEKTFDKIIYFLKEINDNNKIINNFRYENNVKILFDIICEILNNIYEYIKNDFNIDNYVNTILLPKIYNIHITNIPVESIFHQLILGGVCKLLFTLLLITNNKALSLTDEKIKEFIEYLYNSIIMSKCNENILTLENINKENNSLTITSGFCIKEASNLFILLLFKNNNNDELYNNYIKKLTSIHNLCYWKGDKLSDWTLYYKDKQKSTPFVGLKNLGCTCYINSLLQTFFNIPLLRESLLDCNYSSLTEKNCFYQLKKVFYSLKYLQTTYYTPTSFIENYDNEELNARVQMDIFEFFCDFLDKIEQKLKNSKNENIIKYFFMGRQNDVLTFEGDCNHHRTNESQFYSIQLQVQGKKDIYESLDTLIEGEKMFGDNCIYCPQCDKKLPCTKSQNFKVLPRIFMFVLKRFEFNYQTMQKIKINDYYEFPLILDMNKYTDRYINNGSNEDNTYKLKSIIIHTGNCDSGHYYAFILDEKSNEWYEFNDTKIQRFNIEELSLEAFGNKEEVINDIGKENENTRNAYMLFYEKINKDNCENFDKVDIINKLLNIKQNNGSNIIENINDIDDGDNDFNLLSNDENNNKNEIYNINENNTNTINEKDNNKNEEIQKILNLNNKEMYQYFLNQRLFSGEYHHFILLLFINIFNKINHSEKIIFTQNLCSNNDSDNLAKEIRNFKKIRPNKETSNLENYLLKKKNIYI